MQIRKGRPVCKGVGIIAAVMAAVVLLFACVWHEAALNRAQRDFTALLEENTGRFNEGRLVLSSTNSRDAQRIADTIGGSLRITKNGRFALVTLPNEVTLLDVAGDRALRRYMSGFSLDYHDFSVGTEDTDVATEGDIRANFQTDEPMYPQQTYLDYINIGDSWNMSMGKELYGEKMTIAVIDSGIDTDHPEFTDADGNSIVSTLSYNATDDKVVSTSGIDIIEDEQGHGTAVSGIIASQINGSGVMGVAPDVELLVIKCDVDETGEFKSSADIVFGIYYAIEQDVDVINMSLGGSGSKDMEEALQLAVDSDIICVAAAGNNSEDLPHYPAAYDTVIGVGALADGSWEIADYSNYGVNSDIVAPGTALTTSIDGGYTYQNGTSIAAPIVSAAAVIYKTQCPYSTYEELRADLLAAGKDLGDPGEDDTYGFGALDMNAFICEQKGVITFDYCTEELESTEQVFVRQHTIQNIPEPERENIIFDDWYYDKSYTRVFDYDAWYTTEFVEDVILYAKWVSEDDEDVSVYNYRTLSDGTIEIVNYKGKRRYLTIPNEIDGKVVSSIGVNAFAGNTRLREVIFPDGLVYIKAGAFDGVSRMRKITFTGTLLIDIQENAFHNCTALRTLEVPDSVRTIGKYAFADCTSLTTVRISGNSNLTALGAFAFSRTRIGGLYLPRYVGTGGFDGSVLAFSSDVRSITVHAENSAFAVDGNTLYNADKTRLIYYPASLTGSYTVEDGVEEIGTYAFAASEITGIELNAINIIGVSAFDSCKGLNAVVIPDTVVAMEAGAFRFSAIKQITLSERLTELSAFVLGNTNLTDIHIPAGVEHIQSGAFRNCTYLTTLTFAPEAGLQSIEDSAFENCYLLTDFRLPEALSKIGEKAFRNCYAITTLELPANVSNIGREAFRYCRLLQRVTFAEGCVLSEIPSYCFANCTTLNTVNFSEGITMLGVYAFSNDYLLCSLNFGIESSLTTVGDYCFYTCSALKTIQLPDTVTSIGQFAYAFSGLTEVKLSANVASVGNAAFGACYTLDTITADENNAVYSSVDNVLFSKAVDTVYCVPASRTGSYVLPETVKITAPYSFYYDKLLTAVSLPGGLEDIQMNSFYNCSSLASISIPMNVTNIGRKAFENCKKLADVTFAENSKLQRLGIYTFVNCGFAEITIPASVESMAQYVFSNCNNLRTLRFERNSKLPYVAAYLLNGTMVESVVFEDGSALSSLQAHAFDGARYLKSVDFGDAPVANVDNYAFYGCANLESIVLPEAVTYIGRHAFYDCEKLDRMDIPTAVDYIGESAFFGTNNMKVFFAADELPENVQIDWDKGIAGYFLGVGDYVVTDLWEYSVRSDGTIALVAYKGTAKELTIDEIDGYTVSGIGARCFYGNDFLTRVLLNNHISEIGNYAFYNCDGLTGITIPASVEHIGKYAFAGSNAVVVLDDSSVLKTIDSYAFADNATTVLRLPDSVTTIGDGAFSGSALETIQIGETSGLTTIGREAFAGSRITEIYLPAALENVGAEAFKGVSALSVVEIADGDTALKLSNGAFKDSGIQEIAIPARTYYIGEYTFGSCENLQSIQVDSANPSYIDIDGVLCDISGTTLIQYPCGRSGAYEVPEQIKILNCASFKNAKGLTEVDFAEGSTVNVIGWQTFSGCDSLTTITVPDTVVSFDRYAFENCIALTDVILAESSRLSNVCEGAFYGCSELEMIMLPDTVTEIGSYAFYHCASLAVFPLSETSQVNKICDYAFEACKGITEIPVLSELVEVGDYAFANTGIVEFTVGAKIKEITSAAFAGCESFTTIYCNDANEEYVAIDGALYEKGANSVDDLDALCVWPYGKIVVIGEGETEITSKDTAIIKRLPQAQYQIADTVTSIGDYAFSFCSELKEIILPEGLIEIGSGAFSHCDSLAYIKLPDSVTTIGSSAFPGCIVVSNIENEPDNITDNWLGEATLIMKPQKIGDVTDEFFYCIKNDETVVIGKYNGRKSTVVIPEHIMGYPVTQISGTFYGHSNLKNVSIPESVQIISPYTFYNCTGLKEVKLPESTREIGRSAFFGTDLRELTIPENVEYIGNNAFYNGNTSVEYIGIREIHFNATSMEDCVSENGIFNHINGGVRNTVVYIGKNVTRIPAHLFMRDSNNGSQHFISDIIFEAGSVCTSIGNGAFSGNAGLVEVILPELVQEIGSRAFARCDNLNTIILHEGLESIGNNAFERSGLSCIVIPKTVVSMGQSVFKGCTNLKTAGPVDGQFNIRYCWTEEIPAYAFYGADTLASVIISEGVTNIGSHAFYECDGLTEVAALENAVSVGECAFYSCGKLERITIPGGISSLGSSAFYNCVSLKEIKLTEDLNIIPAFAFFNCRSLCDINFPESLTMLGDDSFYGCKSLTTIVIPANITKIGPNVFYNCTNVKEVYFYPEEMNDLSPYSSPFKNAGSTDGIVVTIGKNVKRIPGYLFGSTSTTYPNYIQKLLFEEDSECTSIGTDAFYCCINLNVITIPKKLTTINKGAFGYCTSLEEVYFQATSLNDFSSSNGVFTKAGTEGSGMRIVIGCGVTSIPSYLFCPGSSASSSPNILSVVFEENGICGQIGQYAFAYCGNISNIAFPDSLTRIGSSAFISCNGLKEIAIPASVTMIGGQAFANCSGLESIWVDDGNKYYASDEFGVLLNKGKTHLILCPGAFSGSYYVPETVTYIDKYALHGCSNLTKIIIPESVTNAYGVFSGCAGLTTAGPIGGGYSIEFGWTTAIPDGAFSGCSTLTSVVLPDSINSIPNSAFRDCSKLTSINLPANAAGIGSEAFRGCSKLSDVVIPDKVKYIGSYAFYWCTSLSDITIPVGMTDIANYAFASCTDLKNVMFKGNAPEISNNTLYGVTATVYYPMNNETWTEFVMRNYGGTLTWISYDPCMDGHNYETTVTAPGCTEKGYVTHTCTVCGHSYVDSYTEALGHSYVAVIIAPTCTKQGYTTHTCANCGDSYVDSYVDALGHDMGEWTTVTEATCTKAGSEHRGCSRCDHYETRTIKATGHSYEHVVTAPTCVEKGFVTHTCSACGDSYVDTYVDALGHDMGEWTIVTEATCTEDGSERRDCSRCDHYETHIVKAAGHSFGVWFVNRSATCIRDGENRRNCSVCSHYETEVIPATGHSYESTVTAPTCTEKGYTTHTCATCGDSYVDSYVDAPGHDMGEWTTVTEATCTEDGSERRDCSRCDHYETRVIKAAGHGYESVVTVPTCTEQGYTTHTCTNCGDSYVDTYVDALGHDMGEWTIVTEATCTEDGSERRDCSRCDHYETRTIKAAGHSFGAWFVNRSATCTEDGENRRNCNNCSHYETEVISATGHDYESVVTVPTCTERGYTTHTCANCGDSYVDTYVDALGHDMGAWRTISDATCTKDGQETRDCSRCDYSETRTIKATGHSFGAWFVNRSATCTEDGESRRNCNNCSHYETEIIPATGHDYESTVTAPTCTEQGYTTHTCTACGDSYVDSYTVALGHDWDEGIVTIEPTEDAVGEMTYTCERCGKTRTEIIPELEHEHRYDAVVTDPTCTSTGYTTHTCRCGDSYVDTYVDALGHDTGEWTIVTEATCTEDGSERRDCSRCDHYETRIIKATGHSLGAWLVNRSATCTEDGESRRNCNNCSHYETEIIPATGHDYESTVTAPTCTEQGYTTHTCIACGDSYVDAYVDALGHDMGEWTTVTEATCTEAGSERRDCSRCDHYETRTIKAAGHSFGAWFVNRAATCTETGENRRNCSVCSHYETEVIPATGHSYESTVTAPTCTEQGYTTHTCTICGDSYVDSYVDALGHDMGEWATVTEATCTENGSERRDCSLCDHYETRTIKATGHSYELLVTAPTCVEKGYTIHTCATCGDSYVDSYVDALGHDMGEWVTVTEATCNTDGSERRDCFLCDHYETRTIEAVGHDYESVVTVPYCTEQGYTTYICHCGDRYVSDYTDPLGHDMGAWEISNDATCTEDGQELRECSRCDHSETRVIEALGHQWDEGVVTVEPTEKTEGEMTYTCERCSEIRTEIIPTLEHEHRYDAVITDPTCTEQGYTTHTCRCGDSYVDGYVDALGHDMGEWYIVTEATCTADGMEQRDCSCCEYHETQVIEATGHDYEIIVIEPDCIAQGYTTHICTNCGDSYIDSYTAALGHSFTAYVSDGNATCTQDGTKTSVCDRCDATDTVIDEGSARGHDFTEWTMVQKPTETVEGLESRYCLKCGVEETRAVACLENPFADVVFASFYYEPVMWAVENGITSGTSATTFGPNDQCMRAHVVTFLWRAVGSPEPTKTDNPFVDVKSTDFYYKPVLWAVENGITAGLDADHFGPTAYCNRAQVVTFLYRAKGSPAPERMELPFTDVASDAWYAAPVAWAVETGVTAGLTATTFGPNAICNRAQTVTFLYRVFVTE